MTAAGAPRGGFDRAVVVGSTAWGTTLSILLARNRTPATLLVRTAQEAERLNHERENARRLSGFEFPDGMSVSDDLAVLREAGLICFAVPSRTFATNAAAVAPHASRQATLLSATKGIDVESGLRMSQLLGAAMPGRPIAVLSGPNLSHELAAGLPGTTVVASADASLDAVRAAFHSSLFRVYTSSDVVGVELGGALKNLIAIAAGMVDAFGYGDNARAAVVTRGLAEMTRLGVAAGADALTFQGLAGMGDLVATAYSPLSRNRRLGELIANGASLDDALTTLDETAEGAVTVAAALRMARALDVEMPITAALQRILFEGAAPRDAVIDLMGREPTAEIAATR